MNLKKYMETRVRGWLPKEATLPIYQRTTSHKTWRIPKRFAIFFIVGAFMGALSGALSAYLDLFNTFGVFVWAVIAIVIVLSVGGVVVIRRKRRVELQQEGANIRTTI